MIKAKKHASKSQLLEWVNSLLPHQIPKINKIEELGSGVGYLYILNHQNPKCFHGIKFTKKPTNQHENLNNLRTMINIFQKLGIRYPIDINKIAKMKFQQNLNLIQWFYAQQAKNKQSSSHQNMREISIEPSSRSFSIKIPEKLTFTKPNKSHKMEIQSNLQEETVSARKCLEEIKEIVNNERLSNEKEKINKIKKLFLTNTAPSENFSVLCQKGSQNQQELSQIGTHQSNSEAPKQQQNQYQNSLFCESQKSQSLSDKYDNYIKSSYKSVQQSIRIAEDKKQVFEYEQQERLTDNSILLNYSPSNGQHSNSERKSGISQTDLLGE